MNPENGGVSSCQTCSEAGLRNFEKRNASCSPYRVPIARLAAAHAQINHPRN